MKSFDINRRAALARTMVASLAFPFGAGAQASYPDKPIRLLVPFAAGGTTSTLARALADRMSRALGQPFIVDNRPGAGGNIAMEAAARSAPDGYTLLMGPVGMAINPALYPKLNFDPVKDFAPIGLYGGVANILAVNAALPIHSVKELIAYAKAHPGKLSQGSSGNGSSSHLAGEMLKASAGIDILHVPYKGGAPAMTDVLAGQTSMLFDQVPAVLPHVHSGKVRALAVTTAQRSSAAPDIPTMAEAGVPGYDVNVWFGLLAPTGTPNPIITRLNAEMNKALHDPEFRASLVKMGVDPMPSAPAEFEAFLRAELRRWARIVKTSGAKLD